MLEWRMRLLRSYELPVDSLVCLHGYFLGRQASLVRHVKCVEHASSD
jgi:hypothetical protein